MKMTDLIKNMISALGQLNSELLSAHYGSTMPTPHVATTMVRRANALLSRATMDVRTAQAQQNALEEEVGLSTEAAVLRHVARYTVQSSTMCVGPCTRVPHDQVDQIKEIAQKLYGSDRVAAVRDLSHILLNLPAPNHNNPRLCVATGIPCVAAQFSASGDFRHMEGVKLRINEAAERARLAVETAQEATYTRDLAHATANSQVREMEVGTFEPRVKLNGGGRAPVSSRATIENFFRLYSLGQPVETTDIRFALKTMSTRLAPRARARVVNDLWKRWQHQ